MASLSDIFWIMADLLRPVPASRAPAFWTKKTSSVGGYLVKGRDVRMSVKYLHDGTLDAS